MIHGFLFHSDQWFANSVDKAAGYRIASAGFDVWLGNNRGNKYARKHRYLDPNRDKKKFFDFSFHDNGKYDVPAMVDYIR